MKDGRAVMVSHLFGYDLPISNSFQDMLQFGHFNRAKFYVIVSSQYLKESKP